MGAKTSAVHANLPQISVWTDGSCDNMTGIGGYAAVLRFSTREKLDSTSLRLTTSQRCELHPAIDSLKTLTKRCSVVIYTDSQYLIDGAAKLQRGTWPLGKFHKANQDLWLLLDTAMRRHDVSFSKVKAHSGVEANELVDRLANEARLGRETHERREVGSGASDELSGGQVLEFPSEAVRNKRHASQSITGWPAESEKLFKRFGREVTRLYPFVQHDKEEVPKVMTPLGAGTVKQAFTDGVKVLLDKEKAVVYPKSGKAFSPMREFLVEEVWPLEEKYSGREIGQSGHGHRVSRLRGDREDKEQDGADRHRDKSVSGKGGQSARRDSSDKEAEVGAERETTSRDAQLTLL